VTDPEELEDDLGPALRPGDHHYRAYVGPPADYDLIAALSASLLFCLGLTEHHRLVDLGCGSLRVGRVLIPYLAAGNYTGLEPNRWLIDEGIAHNIGADLVRLRQPRFLERDDFTISTDGTRYDFVLAQSIFSHTQSTLLKHALARVGDALEEDGVLVATFVLDDQKEDVAGSAWVYPEVTSFRWASVQSALLDAGLLGTIIDWPHPRQQWFIASPSENRVRELSRIRRPFSADVG